MCRLPITGLDTDPIEQGLVGDNVFKGVDSFEEYALWAEFSHEYCKKVREVCISEHERVECIVNMLERDNYDKSLILQVKAVQTLAQLKAL